MTTTTPKRGRGRPRTSPSTHHTATIEIRLCSAIEALEEKP